MTWRLSHHCIILGALSLMVATAPSVVATPLIALREANNCGGCHKPGRAQVAPWLRRCTLDCQGCHIDPAGAGPRNQWGYYYSQDQAALVKFINPIDPMQDASFFDLHYDGRNINRTTNGKTRTFPMSSEFAVRLRPLIRYVNITYQNLLLGRTEDGAFRIIREGDRRFREKYSFMVDSLPFNTYVRKYRGQPMYGLRRSNHSLWIRERIGLDQFATTDAVEVGGTPNVPFFRVSQMAGDPYANALQRQRGVSYHAGLRGVTLGWHVNASGWDTQSAAHGIKMNALGGGFNVFQVLLYGEKNERTLTVLDPTLTDPEEPERIHPSSTIKEYTLAYAGVRGLMFGAVLEDLVDGTGHAKRTSFFLDMHPIPFLQFEIWQRQETGVRRLTDLLGVLHLYADF